jgi:hypothetical protein
MEKLVLGEFYGFTLIYEENLVGGIGIWCFLEFYSGFRVRVLRRGTIVCSFCAFGEF